MTGRDVELIEPHIRPGSFQVCGQPKGEFGIVTAVAEKSCLWLCWQANLRVQETYGKDIAAEVGGIESSKPGVSWKKGKQIPRASAAEAGG